MESLLPPCKHHNRFFMMSQSCERVCLLCVANCFEDKDQPYTTQVHLLQYFLHQVSPNPQWLEIFGHDDKFADYFISATITLFHQLQNQVQPMPISNDIVLMLLKLEGRNCYHDCDIIMQLCCSASYRSCLNLLNLVVAMVKQIPESSDCFITNDTFCNFLLNGLDFPDDIIKEILLVIIEELLQAYLHNGCEHNVFVMLPTKLLNLLSSSQSHTILTLSLKLIETWTAFTDISYFFQGTEEMQGKATQDSPKLFLSMKRVLLLRSDPLNFPTIRCLLRLLKHEDFNDHLACKMLDADLVEFIYDVLRASSSEELQIYIFESIIHLPQHKIFFTNCHALHGVSSICMNLNQLLQDASPNVLCAGFSALKVILENQPEDIPLLESLSLFDQILEVVTAGVGSKLNNVPQVSLEALCGLFRQQHVPYPPPYKDMMSMLVVMVTNLPTYYNALVVGK